MSDLPTLWVSPVESTSGAQTGRWTREPSGPMTRPYVAKTNHVPRDELDAANKMAGELGRLMVTRDLERDAARMALVVAEGKLDAANLEIARLRLALDAEHRRCVAVVHDVAQKHRKPDGTRTVEGYGALDAWDALASAKPDVFRTITPKEPSDG